MNKASIKPGGTKSKTPASNKGPQPGSGSGIKKTRSKKKSPRVKESSTSQQQDEQRDPDQYHDLMSAEYHNELDVSMELPAARKKANTINLSLLAQRCLSSTQNGIKPVEIIDQLNNVTHVRLDRENIQNIDGLELFGSNVRNLYLQHNEISEIEGLETLTGLRFLALSHNKIQAVQNIQDTKIGFLDLSHNSIQDLDVEDLPKSLVILSLAGNPCQTKPGYRESILRHCVHLSQLDDMPLTLEERRSAGHEVVSDSEDESDTEDVGAAAYDPSKPFEAQIIGVFDNLSSDMFIRCQSRIQQVFEQHKTKMMNLEKIKYEGHISVDSNPASRISSRMDSPDTDNSRPTTGNTATERPQPAGNLTEPNYDDTDGSFRLSQMKLSNMMLIGDNMSELAHNMNTSDAAVYHVRDNRHNDDELSIVSPSHVSTELSASPDGRSAVEQGAFSSRPNSSRFDNTSYESSRPIQSPGVPKQSARRRTHR